MRLTCVVATGVVLSAFGLAAPAAAAQQPVGQVGPVPVSPGAERRPTIAESCPVFNWAPMEGAAAYELAVYPWLETELGSEPILTTSVPGRAAGWTPAATDCLPAGGTYLWFVRELGVEGQPIGEWSRGLAFRVVGGGVAGSDAIADASNEATPKIGAQPPVTPPDNSNGNPPDSVQLKLDTIISKLDELLAPNSFEFCAEFGVEGEVHTAFGGDFNGEFEGRVGAEGFGNGVMGKVKAKPGWGFGAQLKAGLTPKLVYCFDLLSLPVFNANATPDRAVRMAAVSGAATLDTDELNDRLLALAEKLNLNADRLSNALEVLPDFADGGDPWAALRSDGPVAKLAAAVPLPPGVADRLTNPGQIIENFRAQLALCANSDLPPAVASIVSEFCGLANGERFAKLLDRVDGTVTNVKGSVDTVRAKIDDILGQLPTGDNCKFFCKND